MSGAIAKNTCVAGTPNIALPCTGAFDTPGPRIDHSLALVLQTLICFFLVRPPGPLCNGLAAFDTFSEFLGAFLATSSLFGHPQLLLGPALGLARV